MKYKVIGWTHYDDDMVKEKKYSEAAENAVIDEIRKNKYVFSGVHHQEYPKCVPVLNDGKKRLFSQRHFGGIMAKAYGKEGRYDYAIYAFDVRNEKLKIPIKTYDKSKFEKVSDLQEEFHINVSEETLAKLNEKDWLILDDLDEYRYIDVNDTLYLKTETIEKKFTVRKIYRKKDLTKEEEFFIHLSTYYFDDEKSKQADEMFLNAKTYIHIKVKEIKEENKNTD